MKYRESAGEISVLCLELLNITSNLSVELNRLPYGHFQILRRTSMTSRSDYTDLNDCDLAHHGSLFTPQISEFTHRPVMETINFVHSFQTSL